MQRAAKEKRVWRWLYFGVAATGALAAVAFFLISLQIGFHVRATGNEAIQEYGGDQVSALIAYADSPSHSLRDRNRAVWALGHLGDPRALPVLETYNTGRPCDHSRTLCQRELGKAIRLCQGGVNLPALVWRRLDE